MPESQQKKPFVSPATSCEVTPEGKTKCCTPVIETYTSAEFARTEITNVEDHCAVIDPEHPENTSESFTGNQDVG